MAKGGIVDNDRGLQKIRQNIAALGNLSVKVGIPEGAGSQDGVTIAEYAAWNEYGVEGPPVSQHGGNKWFIPPRPFVRGWVENNQSQIKHMTEILYKSVVDGKLDADNAIGLLGQFGQDGIKRFIRSGKFTPNADSTIAKKKSSKPLIDIVTMLSQYSL